MARNCLLLSIVLVMIFTLSACGPAGEPVSPAVEEGEEVIFPDPSLRLAVRGVCLEKALSMTQRWKDSPYSLPPTEALKTSPDWSIALPH